MNAKRWLLAGAFLIVGFCLGAVAAVLTVEQNRQWLEISYHRYRMKRLEGRPAPQVETSTLNGDRWNLGSKRGKVVVIDFFTTWCAPCRMTLSTLDKAYRKYGSRTDFEIVCVSLDEDPELVRQYV